MINRMIVCMLMVAAQPAPGNRLDWRQLGSHLPDLHILQSGGLSLTITQY